MMITGSLPVSLRVTSWHRHESVACLRLGLLCDPRFDSGLAQVAGLLQPGLPVPAAGPAGSPALGGPDTTTQGGARPGPAAAAGRASRQ